MTTEYILAKQRSFVVNPFGRRASLCQLMIILRLVGVGFIANERKNATLLSALIELSQHVLREVLEREFPQSQS